MLHRAVAGWPGLGWPLRPLLNVELKPWLLSRSFPHVSSSLGHSTNFLTSPTFVLSKLWATGLGFYFYRTQDKCFVLFVGLFYNSFNVIWEGISKYVSNMSMDYYIGMESLKVTKSKLLRYCKSRDGGWRGVSTQDHEEECVILQSAADELCGSQNCNTYTSTPHQSRLWLWSID